MAERDNAVLFPVNAMIATFVLNALESRGVLRRTNLTQTIRKLSDTVPERLIGDQRVASLCALRALLDDPDSRRDFPFGWPWD